MDRKIIIGNWKMNPSSQSVAKKNFLEIKKGAAGCKKTDVSVAPPFLFIPELSKLASVSLSISAQNTASEWDGASTGEISAEMLFAFKSRYVILGHSERRALGETNMLISKKIKMALKAKITPVLCIGESERDGGMWHFGKIKTQLEECLHGLSKNIAPLVVIAYEPVWAISTNPNARPATPSDCEEMAIYVSKVLSDLFGVATAEKVRILYGGSVDKKNAEGFLRGGRISGLLVGKSSLSPKKFLEIIKIANKC